MGRDLEGSGRRGSSCCGATGAFLAWAAWLGLEEEPDSPRLGSALAWRSGSLVSTVGAVWRGLAGQWGQDRKEGDTWAP